MKNRSQTSSNTFVASSTASGNVFVCKPSASLFAYGSLPQLLILIYRRAVRREQPAECYIYGGNLTFDIPFAMHSLKSSSGSSSVPCKHSGIVPLNVCCRFFRLAGESVKRRESPNDSANVHVLSELRPINVGAMQIPNAGCEDACAGAIASVSQVHTQSAAEHTLP